MAVERRMVEGAGEPDEKQALQSIGTAKADNKRPCPNPGKFFLSELAILRRLHLINIFPV
jgi:hypothetical protein